MRAMQLPNVVKLNLLAPFAILKPGIHGIKILLRYSNVFMTFVFQIFLLNIPVHLMYTYCQTGC